MRALFQPQEAYIGRLKLYDEQKMTGVPHQGHRVNHEGTTSMPKKHEKNIKDYVKGDPLIIRFSWGLINFNNNSNNNNNYY